MQAWLAFLEYCLGRQARARLMLAVSIALLGIVGLLIHLNTRMERWTMLHWRMTVPSATNKLKDSTPVRAPLREVLRMAATPDLLPLSPGLRGVDTAVVGAVAALAHDAAGPRLFTGAIVVGLLASFLMPLWSLTFATETLGRAREDRTLTWLLLRPVPRWSMYLAAWLSALPGAIAFNVGGFALFCWLGGEPGRFAWPRFWFPVVLGSFAFTALFQLLSVAFQRAAIIGLVYAFFLETIASNLPGQQKFLSISYYVRCLIVDAAQGAGVELHLAGTRPIVSATTATTVLVAATVILTVAGIAVFVRKEYSAAAG